jgi:ATP synthase protein I
MKSKNVRDELKKSVKISVNKIEKAKKERPTVLAQTTYLGTIGFIFILPVIIGAYLGVWLDDKLKGFSISWTISLIIVGVFIGAMNVYLFIKE